MSLDPNGGMVFQDDPHPCFLPLQQSAVYGRAAAACGAKVRRLDLGIGFALPAPFTLALPDSAVRLWEWRKDGQLQAAMAFVRHGRSASYHLGWASPVARLAGVHRLMLVRAAEALQTEGVCWLDLGSVNTDAAPGLARFKLGSGAALRPLGATLLVLP